MVPKPDGTPWLWLLLGPVSLLWPSQDEVWQAQGVDSDTSWLCDLRKLMTLGTSVSLSFLPFPEHVRMVGGRITVERNQKSRSFYCCYKPIGSWFQILTLHFFPMSRLCLCLLKRHITSLVNMNSILQVFMGQPLHDKHWAECCG